MTLPKLKSAKSLRQSPSHRINPFRELHSSRNPSAIIRPVIAGNSPPSRKFSPRANPPHKSFLVPKAPLCPKNRSIFSFSDSRRRRLQPVTPNQTSPKITTRPKNPRLRRYKPIIAENTEPRSKTPYFNEALESYDSSEQSTQCGSYDSAAFKLSPGGESKLSDMSFGD